MVDFLGANDSGLLKRASPTPAASPVAPNLIGANMKTLRLCLLALILGLTVGALTGCKSCGQPVYKSPCNPVPSQVSNPSTDPYYLCPKKEVPVAAPVASEAAPATCEGSWCSVTSQGTPLLLVSLVVLALGFVVGLALRVRPTQE